MTTRLSEEEFNKLSGENQRRYLKVLKGEKGKEDLIYLSKEILGYEEVEEGVHRALEVKLKSKKRKKLILLPRGSFKTSLGTISYAIQKILNNRDIRILLDSEILENSVKILGKVKEHLRDDSFVNIYGSLIDNTKRETAREFTVKGRKKANLKEATMYAAGVGTVQVGPHYELIIADDLHSEKNVSTKEQIDKVIAHYRLLLSLLEPGGELVIIGTRWSFYDLYDFILEDIENGYDAGWEVYVEKAIREDGSLYFPNRLTREFLDEQRLLQGAYLFSVLYQNEPVSGETQTFKKEVFKYWGSEKEEYPKDPDGKRKKLNVYILIDRAFSKSEKADYTGCICVGVDWENRLYVLEALRQKCGLNELFETICSWIGRYGKENVRNVGIETINYEEVETLFRQLMGKKNQFFILTRLSPDGKMSKEGRIESALQSRYANGAVFHRKRMIDLEDELLKFPVGTHDDLIDALAYVVTMMTAAPNDAEEKMYDYEPSGFFGKSGY